jgi:hypothetical protein
MRQQAAVAFEKKKQKRKKISVNNDENRAQLSPFKMPHTLRDSLFFLRGIFLPLS